MRRLHYLNEADAQQFFLSEGLTMTGALERALDDKETTEAEPLKF